MHNYNWLTLNLMCVAVYLYIQTKVLGYIRKLFGLRLGSVVGSGPAHSYFLVYVKTIINIVHMKQLKHYFKFTMLINNSSNNY